MQTEVFLPKYCLEYMITGVHSQLKYADCVICSKDKYIREYEIEQEKLKEQEEEDRKLMRQFGGEKDCPKEEDFDDAFDNLREAAIEDSDEEIGETELQRIQRENEQFIAKLDKVQQGFIKNTITSIKDKSGIEFILDNSMGQIVNPNNISESRFVIASRCLSQALEQIKPNQLYNIITTENIWFSDEGLTSTNNLSVSDADNFLLDLNLHGQKFRIIDVLAERIRKSSEQTTTLVVFTDFITANENSNHKQIIEDAISARQNPISIHIISFNILGVDAVEQKQSTYEFFRSIAQKTKGSFTGILSVDEEVKQEIF